MSPHTLHMMPRHGEQMDSLYSDHQFSSFCSGFPNVLTRRTSLQDQESVHAWNTSFHDNSSTTSPDTSSPCFSISDAGSLHHFASPLESPPINETISLASCMSQVLHERPLYSSSSIVPGTIDYNQNTSSFAYNAIQAKRPKAKKPSKVCQHPGGCGRYSQGGTRYCISHGGGKRCSIPHCNKSVQGSRSRLCIAHGGGKRCEVTGCDHAARGATMFCVAHGGGARCQEIGCHKSAQRPSDFCIAHGGGRRCSAQGCIAILRGSSTAKLCARHALVEPLLDKHGAIFSGPQIKTVTKNS